MIAVDEGIVPAAYYDVVGVRTVYIGHTAAAGAPSPLSISLTMPLDSELDAVLKEAWSVFSKDLLVYTAAVVAKMGPDLKQHELDGWVGFHFNTGGIYRTSAVAKWRSGDKAGAVRVLKQWNKGTINGQKRVLQALVARRDDEAALILGGVYPNKPLAVWGTNGRGKVQWGAPLRTYTFAKWAAFLGKSRGSAAADGAAVAVGGGAIAVAMWWDKIEAFFRGLF